MPFKLKVEFVGVCLFVPDPKRKTLFVLMPGAGHDHGVGPREGEDPRDGVPPHVVRLCVDTAYLIRDSEETNDVIALADLDGMDLMLGDASKPGRHFPPQLPSDVVDVGAVTRRSIFPRALGDDLGSMLSGRVRLRSGDPSGPEDGVCWTYAGKRQRLLNRTSWVMDYPGDDLVLFKHDAKAPKIPPLYPIGGVIEVAIYHTPREELPPTPREQPHPADVARHFSAYYSLFASMENVLTPTPEFWGDGCDGPRGHGGGLGGSPYTCMLAQSPPVWPAPTVPPPL